MSSTMKHHKSHVDCQCVSSNNSVCQTLNEMEFERGIWNAAYHGDMEKLKKHLSKGVDPNVNDSSGYTALHYASRQGHFDICEELLRCQADPNVATPAGAIMPLHRAAYQGHLDIVRLLVKHGASVEAIDNDGRTPLHKAAEHGKASVCEFLLNLRPETASLQDKHHQTPADLAKESCIKEIFSIR